MLLVNILISAILISTQSIAKPYERVIAGLSAGRAPKEVPLLQFEGKEVNEAINSKRLLLLLDYHGTIMGYDKQNHPTLVNILKEISRTADLVITSGGADKELIEHFGDIPRLTIASEYGAKVIFEGKEIKGAPPGTHEQVQKIKQIVTEVLNDLAKALDRDEYIRDKLFEPYPDREWSYRIRIGVQVDSHFVSLLLDTVQKKLKDEGLTAWMAEVPPSRRLMNFRLASEDKAVLTNTIFQRAIAEGNGFDYAIGMGDSDADEPLLEYLNHHKFLSVIVHNSFHKRVHTSAQFRLTNADEAQDLLKHIADERIKNKKL